MVRPGRHAADDGSFRRSAGMAAGRGALLLFVAVVIGIVVLNKTDDTSTTTVNQSATSTTQKKSTGSTTPTTFLTTTTLAAHDPASVKVLPVNGTDTSGVGTRAKDVLLAARYNALAPTDAKNKPVAATVIYFAPGYQPDAAVLVTLLHVPGTPNLQPMPADRTTLVKDAHNVATAAIIVVVGNDIANALPKTSTTTTSTTAKSSTTTSTTAKPASTTSTTKKP